MINHFLYSSECQNRGGASLDSNIMFHLEHYENLVHSLHIHTK